MGLVVGTEMLEYLLIEAATFLSLLVLISIGEEGNGSIE
jgi:hypothetical protein